MSQQIDPLRRSSRLATVIPWPYWHSIGYSYEDAISLENLQKDMKKYREDENETIIELHVKDDQGVRRPNVKLPISFELMHPHWRKLMKALHGRTRVDEVDIIGMYLPWNIPSVPSALESMKLTTLRLCDTGMSANYFACQRLATFLYGNSSLRTLVFGMDQIDDVSVATTFSDAIKYHPNLENVIFAQCGLSNPTILSKVLEGCTGIKQLAIGYERFRSEGINVISDFIGSNHSGVGILFLYDNKISDRDTVPLASALKMNTHMYRLDLSRNDVTEEGEKNLMNVLYDPTSMDSIVESNHKCVPHIYNMDDAPAVILRRSELDIELFIINSASNLTIGQKIRKKVVLAICGFDGKLFDLSHLKDLPLGVMPHVLILIQEHTTIRTKRFSSEQLEKDALSRLFHTLRGWGAPLLEGPPESVAARTKKRRRSARR